MDDRSIRLFGSVKRTASPVRKLRRQLRRELAAYETKHRMPKARVMSARRNRLSSAYETMGRNPWKSIHGLPIHRRDV